MLSNTFEFQRLDPHEETERIRSDASRPNYSGRRQQVFNSGRRQQVELTDVLRFPCENFRILVQKFSDSDKISSRSDEISIGSGKISPTFCCFLKSLTPTNLPATCWRSNPPNPISLSISDELMATTLNQVWLDSG